MTSMHFYAWKKGLKTGMYYLRSRPAAEAIKFTVDQSTAEAVKAQPKVQATVVAPPPPKQEFKNREEFEAAKLACSRANPEGCLMCSA